jgi:hypothetical protein
MITYACALQGQCIKVSSICHVNHDSNNEKRMYVCRMPSLRISFPHFVFALLCARVLCICNLHTYFRRKYASCRRCAASFSTYASSFMARLLIRWIINALIYAAADMSVDGRCLETMDGCQHDNQYVMWRRKDRTFRQIRSNSWNYILRNILHMHILRTCWACMHYCVLVRTLTHLSAKRARLLEFVACWGQIGSPFCLRTPQNTPRYAPTYIRIYVLNLCSLVWMLVWFYRCYLFTVCVTHILCIYVDFLIE